MTCNGFCKTNGPSAGAAGAIIHRMLWRYSHPVVQKPTRSRDFVSLLLPTMHLSSFEDDAEGV